MTRLGRWMRRPPGLGSALDQRLEAHLEFTPGELEEWALARLGRRLTLAGHPTKDDPREALARLPLLRRDELAEAPERWLDPRVPRGLRWRARSSGSSGQPLTVWRDPLSSAREEAFLRRHLGVFGWEPDWPELAVRGGAFEGVRPSRTRGGWEVAAARLGDETARATLRAVAERSIRLIRGYPSALLELLRRAEGLGLDPRGPELVHVSSETLTPAARERIAAGFGAPVLEQYGQAERALLAQSCPEGTLHLMTDYGWGEVVDGRWVGTPLFGTLLLLRYDTGDEAGPAPRGCPCGWPFPAIGPIAGRQDDLILTTDGRRVGRLGPALRAVPGVRAVQVEQDGTRLLVRFSPGSSALGRGLERALGELLADPDLEIVLRPDEAPVREASGKVRAVRQR